MFFLSCVCYAFVHVWAGCTLPGTTDFDCFYGLFASKLFLEAFDMVDTCNMNTNEGVWGRDVSLSYVN